MRKRGFSRAKLSFVKEFSSSKVLSRLIPENMGSVVLDFTLRFYRILRLEERVLIRRKK